MDQTWAGLEPAILGSEVQRFIHQATGLPRSPVVLSLMGASERSPELQVWAACVVRLRQGLVARGLDARVSARSVAASHKPPTLATRV